jgi:ubiquinone/menaquinone biosynthesis C-methylase UbiE
LLFLALAGLTGVAEAPRDPVPARMPGDLFPASRAPMLDSSTRDRWQKPALLVAALDLKPGDAVADVGAGSGYMMPYLSRAVGPRGRVYAQEIQPAMLRLLAARAVRYSNVHLCYGSVDDPGLSEDSLDRALLLTAYHEVATPVALLSRLRSAMRPGGRLLIVDWSDFAAGEGTPLVAAAERVPERVVCREAERAGWQLLRCHPFLPYQYCLEFGLSGRKE